MESKLVPGCIWWEKCSTAMDGSADLIFNGPGRPAGWRAVRPRRVSVREPVARWRKCSAELVSDAENHRLSVFFFRPGAGCVLSRRSYSTLKQILVDRDPKA